MSSTLVNKYKQFLNTPQENKTDNAFKSSKWLPFYNPKKELINKNKCVCRVLPNKHGESFFYEFKKHFFKVGTSYKQTICAYTIDPRRGEMLGDDCPFCDFLNENRKNVSTDCNKAFMPKTSYTMLVYDYTTDTIQKYDAGFYDIQDIMKDVVSIIENEDDFNIDDEGFDLIFHKNDAGWPAVKAAKKPSVTLADLFNESTNMKELPDLWKEIHVISDKVKTSINETYQYGLRAFAPTYSSNASESSTKYQQNYNSDEDYDYVPPKTTGTLSQKDTNDIIDKYMGKADVMEDLIANNVISEPETPVTKKIIVEPEESTNNNLDDDDDVQSIKSLIAELKAKNNK